MWAMEVDNYYYYYYYYLSNAPKWDEEVESWRENISELTLIGDQRGLRCNMIFFIRKIGFKSP